MFVMWQPEQWQVIPPINNQDGSLETRKTGFSRLSTDDRDPHIPDAAGFIFLKTLVKGTYQYLHWAGVLNAGTHSPDYKSAEALILI